MIVSIVACGQSAKDWHKTPCDLSIGVNDVLKFNHSVDQLVLINFERKFTPERLNIIKATKAKVFTHTQTWKKHFPSAQVIKLTPFNKVVRPGFYYSSRTSPMVALSLAIKAKATDIVLFGIDFDGHKTFKRDNRDGIHEISKYLMFLDGVRKLGINVWRGADGTAFDLHMPLYEPVWSGYYTADEINYTTEEYNKMCKKGEASF